MLSWPAKLRVYFCVAPTDMRKSFDGLSGLVASVFERTLLDGDLFLFLNKRRDRVKLLYWDRDGIAIWAKRLESGTFETPRVDAQQKHLELDATELAMLLSGVSLSTVKRRKRYTPAASAVSSRS
jgi:transposase